MLKNQTVGEFIIGKLCLLKLKMASQVANFTMILTNIVDQTIADTRTQWRVSRNYLDVCLHFLDAWFLPFQSF